MNNASPIFGFIPRSRYVGYGLLLIPIIFLMMFAVGEILGREPSGIVHIIQIVPLIVLGILARKYTTVAGVSLIITSLSLSAYYFLSMNQMTFWAAVLVEGVLFLPPFLAGLFFIRIARK